MRFDRRMSEAIQATTRHSALEVSPSENGLVTKAVVAKATTLSVRTIENLANSKRIPVVRISPRCVRYHLPSVLAALRRFEVKAVS